MIKNIGMGALMTLSALAFSAGGLTPVAAAAEVPAATASPTRDAPTIAQQSDSDAKKKKKKESSSDTRGS